MRSGNLSTDVRRDGPGRPHVSCAWGLPYRPGLPAAQNFPTIAGGTPSFMVDDVTVS